MMWPPSSSGRGHRVLNPVTGVRLPLGVFDERPRSRFLARLGHFDVCGCLLKSPAFRATCPCSRTRQTPRNSEGTSRLSVQKLSRVSPSRKASSANTCKSPTSTTAPSLSSSTAPAYADAPTLAIQEPVGWARRLPMLSINATRSRRKGIAGCARR